MSSSFSPRFRQQTRQHTHAVVQQAAVRRRQYLRLRHRAIAAPPAGRLRRILVNMQRNRAAGGVDGSGFAAVNSYDAGS